MQREQKRADRRICFRHFIAPEARFGRPDLCVGARHNLAQPVRAGYAVQNRFRAPQARCTVSRLLCRDATHCASTRLTLPTVLSTPEPPAGKLHRESRIEGTLPLCTGKGLCPSGLTTAVVSSRLRIRRTGLEVSSKRRQSVENARQAWIKRLIDLSRRNNLLYYRSLKWGTLNLTLQNSDRWAALLRGDSVSLKTLVPSLQDEELLQKAVAIWRRAQANQEEKGFGYGDVAFGMASWKAADGGRDSDSAVLLLPVTLDLKGHSGNSLAVRRSGSIQANLVLLHVLQTEFGVTISPENVLSSLQGNEEGEVFHLSFSRSCPVQ